MCSCCMREERFTRVRAPFCASFNPFGFQKSTLRWAACNEIRTQVSRFACCNPSDDGCPGCDTKIPALVAKIDVRSAVWRLEDECINVWIQSGGSATVSISGVKIEKRAQKLILCKCFNVLSGGGGKKERKKERRSLPILSGSCDKTLKRKRDVFVLVFCTFHWSHLNVILLYKKKTILCSVPFGCFSYSYLSLFILSCISLETFTKDFLRETFRSGAAFSSVDLMRSNLGGSAER